MKCIEDGHIYELDTLDSGDPKIKEILIFVNRNEFKKHPGTTNQEVLRALIHRVKYMHQQMPWHLNAEIIKHLEMAIALHEARALIRKIEKSMIDIADLPTGNDGHIIFSRRADIMTGSDKVIFNRALETKLKKRVSANESRRPDSINKKT